MNNNHEFTTRIINRSIVKAKENGADQAGQIQNAVAVLQWARPDLNKHMSKRLVQQVMAAKYKPVDAQAESITRVIRHTVASARKWGLESNEQWKLAVNAVRTIRPDLGPSEVQQLVERVMAG